MPGLIDHSLVCGFGHAFRARRLEGSSHAHHGHHLDDDPAAVELPPSKAMSSGSGKGVMIVVPAFAECQNADNRIVPAVIMAVIGLRTPDVAYRIHAPGDMMLEEDSDESAPEEAGQCSEPAAAENAAQNRRDEQAQENPERKQLADDLKITIGLEIRNIALLIRLFDAKQPTEMGVDESTQTTTTAHMR